MVAVVDVGTNLYPLFCVFDVFLLGGSIYCYYYRLLLVSLSIIAVDL